MQKLKSLTHPLIVYKTTRLNVLSVSLTSSVAGKAQCGYKYGLISQYFGYQAIQEPDLLKHSVH